jgi:hypothetical protein
MAYGGTHCDGHEHGLDGGHGDGREHGGLPLDRRSGQHRGPSILDGGGLIDGRWISYPVAIQLFTLAQVWKGVSLSLVFEYIHNMSVVKKYPWTSFFQGCGTIVDLHN